MRVPVAVAVAMALTAASCGGHGNGMTALGADDSGSEVAVGVGETIEVELESDPSTGYAWEVVEVPAALMHRGDEFREPDADGTVGATGSQLLTFAATGRGAGVLRLEYVRPFDDPPVAVRVAEFVVRVDGAPWPPATPGPTPSVTSAAAPPVRVEDLAGAAPGPVTVEGVVVWDESGARLCELLLESYPPQCGGVTVAIANPEAVDVPLDEAQGVRWTPGPVTLDGDLDGDTFVVRP